MTDPKLIFITGPSGAGKSTTAEGVAAGWPGVCAVLKFDEIRRLVRSGYAEPAIQWNDEAARQWDLAKHVVIAMTQAYLRGGVSVVLEAFATPGDFPTWRQLIGDLPYTAIVLLPAMEVVLARNSQRSGVARLRASDIRQNYEWSAGWAAVPDVRVLDTSTKTARDVIREILDSRPSRSAGGH